MPPVAPAPSPPAQPDAPSPKVTCGDCGFTFIVGSVAEAPCPNCGTTVLVGATPEES